jgi:hypothetical protein
VATYRVIAADLLTGRLITEVPVSACEFECALNGAGAMTASVSLGSRRIEAVRTIIAGTAPARTAWYIERDGELVWGGIVWGRRYLATTRTLRLDGREFLSYFTKRYPESDIDWTHVGSDGVVASDAIKALIGGTMEQASGRLGWEWANPAFQPTGQARVRDIWAFDEGKTVLDRVLQVAVQPGGPDVWTSAEYTDGYVRRILHLGNDRDSLSAGRPVSQTGLEFALGVEALDLEATEDGLQASNTVRVVGGLPDGAASGTRPPTAEVGLGAPLVEGWPILETQIGVPLAQDATSVNSNALGYANMLWRPRASIVAPIRGSSPRYPFGTYDVGDGASVRVDPGVDPRFPDGLLAAGRIAAYTVKWDASGEDTVPSLALEEVVL